jgi:hypothetical protein
MDARERHAMLTTGRSGEFRNLVRDLTNDPRDFPTKSELKARLAELYPGDEYAAVRDGVFERLVRIAQARVAGMDLLELRGIVDEYVIQVETELTKDDALIPAEDTEPVDVSAVMESIDNYDPTARNSRAVQAAAKAAELEANRIRMAGGH